jgi:hypothetical protein
MDGIHLYAPEQAIHSQVLDLSTSGGGMAKGISVARFEDIQRLIKLGHKDRAIARTLQCRRLKVAQIRRGEAKHPSVLKQAHDGPLWTQLLDWDSIQKELKDGHELKKIWEEKVSKITTYSNFWKQLNRKFPLLMKETVTLRSFNPGEHCEVDYAGDRIEWIDSRGEIREAHIFIGILCFSQLIFAHATENEKSVNWLNSHRKMYEFFQGVPKVTVCDCLKTGVIKCHRYDPDLNPTYTEFAAHYKTAIVPARPKHPKDKALVEGAVKLVMRAFRWTYRRHTFTSIEEVNRALLRVMELINNKIHTRFKTSRVDRFLAQEKANLKKLPELPYEDIEWFEPRVHPDCTVGVDHNFYSAPHIYRGKLVRVKLTSNQVEIFWNLERIALHPRKRGYKGYRELKFEHFPPNSQAYMETTPQNILSQARFIHDSMRTLIQTLFEVDTLGNLRRAQGLVRRAQVEIRNLGRTEAEPIIVNAIAQMIRFEKFRVAYFDETLKKLKKQKTNLPKVDREIERLPGNPMLRRTTGIRSKEEENTQSEFQFKTGEQ